MKYSYQPARLFWPARLLIFFEKSYPARLFHPAPLLNLRKIPACSFIQACSTIRYLRVLVWRKEIKTVHIKFPWRYANQNWTEIRLKLNHCQRYWLLNLMISQKGKGHFLGWNCWVILTNKGYISEVIWFLKCFYGGCHFLIQYSITCLSIFLWCS